MWRLTKLTFKAFKNDKNLLITNLLSPFIEGPMIVIEVYIMSWLFSLMDPDKGPIYDKDTVYQLYQI